MFSTAPWFSSCRTLVEGLEIYGDGRGYDNPSSHIYISSGHGSMALTGYQASDMRQFAPVHYGAMGRGPWAIITEEPPLHKAAPNEFPRGSFVD